MKKFRLIALIILVVGVAFSAFAISNHHSTKATTASTSAIPSTGTWLSTGDQHNVSFKATITPDGQIEIDMRSDVVSGPFWIGSFPTVLSDGQYVSTPSGDPTLTGKTLKTLDFTIKNGVITYDFTMLNLPKWSVHLVRSTE
jgi:hypothetical protein